jgi:DNA-binding CsgD family transcriptional regulator
MQRFKVVSSLLQWITIFILAANFIFIILDLTDDIQEHMRLIHILPELLTAISTLALIAILFIKLRASNLESTKLRQKIDQLESEATTWRQKTSRMSEGLSKAIDEQLESWSLSAAEKEVALLLLKGLSNKLISEIRNTSEQTVKQQSSSIYRKSNLNSRAELSAFFLEDLLMPRNIEIHQPLVSAVGSNLDWA